MKKINLLFLALTMAFSFNLSAQTDVGCTAVNAPAAGDTIFSNSQIAPNYTRKNFGAALPANSPQLIMIATFDGDSIAGFFRNMANPWAAGADETISGQPINFGNLSPTPTQGNHKFCMTTKMSGDANKANDTSCVTIYYSSASAPIDLSITNVQVAVPTPANGNEFATDESLDEITLTINNVGGIAIAAGTVLPIDFTVGGVTVALQLRLQAALAPAATLNSRATRAAVAALPNFPSALGNFDVCCKINFSGDTDNSNDENCFTYKMVPGVTPTISSFNPTSGPCLTKVTINGTNFNPIAAQNVVKFKTATANVLTATATKLEVEVPNGALSGKVSVTVNVGGSDKKGESAANFTYTGCTIGIDELNNSLYSVYYSNDMVNISLAGNSVIGDKEVQILNVSGQVVITKVLAFNGSGSEIEEINVSNLTAGAYIVLIDGNAIKFSK